jgi:hypothetical protein
MVRAECDGFVARLAMYLPTVFMTACWNVPVHPAVHFDLCRGLLRSRTGNIRFHRNPLYRNLCFIDRGCRAPQLTGAEAASSV